MEIVLLQTNVNERPKRQGVRHNKALGTKIVKDYSNGLPRKARAAKSNSVIPEPEIAPEIAKIVNQYEVQQELLKAFPSINKKVRELKARARKAPLIEPPAIEQAEVQPAPVAPEKVVITPPRFQRATIKIAGTTPLVVSRFSEKAINQIEATQRAGQQARSRRKREARNFEADYERAFHIEPKRGWKGHPASAFRNAMISACRTAGFAMTRAKLSIFVEPDGFDQDGVPLVRIDGTPEPTSPMPARNANGSIDLRVRPMWREWKMAVTVRWDLDQFSATDVLNLMARAGMSVGIGEGRPDSRESNGLGWGLWEIVP